MIDGEDVEVGDEDDKDDEDDHDEDEDDHEKKDFEKWSVIAADICGIIPGPVETTRIIQLRSLFGDDDNVGDDEGGVCGSDDHHHRWQLWNYTGNRKRNYPIRAWFARHDDDNAAADDGHDDGDAADDGGHCIDINYTQTPHPHPHTAKNITLTNNQVLWWKMFLSEIWSQFWISVSEGWAQEVDVKGQKWRERLFSVAVNWSIKTNVALSERGGGV